MANHAAILRELTNPNRLYTQLPVHTEQLMEELNRVWEWDEVTGLPVFQDSNHVFKRHVPSELLPILRQTPEGRSFACGMTGNTQSFSVNCTSNPKRQLISRILIWDLKKLEINDERTGFQVTKFNAPLRNYDQMYDCPALKASHDRKTRKKINELIEEINLNSARGFTGPGTYRCRHPNCTVSGPLMSQSPIVTWGPNVNQSVRLVKRFSCKCNNVVYLLHCDACVRQGLWTTYVGETEKFWRSDGNSVNFHSRIPKHVDQLSDNVLCRTFPKSEDSGMVCQGVIQFDDPDPYNITKDPYSHFNFVHSPDDRRYTILDTGYTSKARRRVHEGILMHQFGDSVYNPISRSGALNRF